MSDNKNKVCSSYTTSAGRTGCTEYRQIQSDMIESFWFCGFNANRLICFFFSSAHLVRLQNASGNAQGGDNKEKRRKESILDLSKYLEKTIRVKFAGGREAAGVLKGYDPLLNLVLDNTVEYLRDSDEPFKLAEDTRSLGLVVCRGTSVVLICPQDGMESIQNPFITQDA